MKSKRITIHHYDWVTPEKCGLLLVGRVSLRRGRVSRRHVGRVTLRRGGASRRHVGRVTLRRGRASRRHVGYVPLRRGRASRRRVSLRRGDLRLRRVRRGRRRIAIEEGHDGHAEQNDGQNDGQKDLGERLKHLISPSHIHLLDGDSYIYRKAK